MPASRDCPGKNSTKTSLLGPFSSVEFRVDFCQVDEKKVILLKSAEGAHIFFISDFSFSSNVPSLKMGKPRMSSTGSLSPSGKPRNRSGDLGRAYDHLRDMLPTYQSDRKKLTKIETLKLATIYISDLAGLLDEVKTDPTSALSADVRLTKRSRRNSNSSTEMSRSGSYQSLSSSSPSCDLFCPSVSPQTAVEVRT